MECPAGCISGDVCSDNTSIIVTAIFLAFVGFCGAQMCYIVSLSKKITRLSEGIETDDSGSLIEIPPPYQRVENM